MSPGNGRTEEIGELSIMNFVPAELAEFGKKRIEAIVEIQRELLETFEAINQAWFERARSEASLTSELMSKLSTARTVPETASACRECLGKQMDLLADDSRRFFADSQKFFHLGARFLNGTAVDSNRPKDALR
jgi:hypothetical protein